MKYEEELKQDMKFTIIMAAYNAAQFIEEAIDSVKNQTYKDWELIVVDDGSKDDTSEIIDRYSLEDSRIIAIHQENSGTAAAARSVALKIAAGDFIQILDSDDLLGENLLEQYFCKIKEANPDILVPNCRYFSEQQVYWEKRGFRGDYTAELDGIQSFYYSLDWTIHGLFCAKSELVKTVGYDKALLNGDEFTSRKMLFQSRKTVFVDEYYYFRRNSNSTTQSSKNMARMFECLVTEYNIYRFSLEKDMPENCVEKTYQMLCWSLISHQQKYERNKACFTEEEKQRVNDILRSVYSSTMRELIHRRPNKFSLILLTSLMSYSLFCLENALVAEFRKRF